MHIHLNPFHVLARHPVTVTIPHDGITDTESAPTVHYGRGTDNLLTHVLDANELGLKDTIRVNPNEIVELAVRFHELAAPASARAPAPCSSVTPPGCCSFDPLQLGNQRAETRVVARSAQAPSRPSGSQAARSRSAPCRQACSRARSAASMGQPHDGEHRRHHTMRMRSLGQTWSTNMSTCGVAPGTYA